MSVSSFREVFDNRHVVLPVVHVTSLEQTLRNVAISMEAGADGVFLINHSFGADQLLAIHAEVSRAFPGWWTGVNCLGVDPTDVFGRLSADVKGVWVDNAMVDERQDAQLLADAVLKARTTSAWKGLYFGGVAFKGQRGVDDLASASRIARGYMDVVTTSGSGTGHAADIDKIRTMKAPLDEFPLAIASGITPDNIHNYLPHSDCYLVATGISHSFDELDQLLLTRLIGAVRAHDWESRNQRNGIVSVDGSSGLVFKIDLTTFDEPQPIFAYWDNDGSNAAAVNGLTDAGWMDITHDGILHCKLFKASRDSGDNSVASFESLMPCEFRVKIFRVKTDKSTELLWHDNFNIK